jgi:hypothetical protein
MEAWATSAGCRDDVLLTRRRRHARRGLSSRRGGESETADKTYDRCAHFRCLIEMETSRHQQSALDGNSIAARKPRATPELLRQGRQVTAMRATRRRPTVTRRTARPPLVQVRSWEERARSSPAKRGRGTMQSMVEGARGARELSAPSGSLRSPPPPLRGGGAAPAASQGARFFAPRRAGTAQVGYRLRCSSRRRTRRCSSIL